MNYLAHAYLSFGSDTVLVGNMVSDFVKGKDVLNYPPPIQKGIRLHRLIDSFTDAHPVNKEARGYLRSGAGRYSGAFLDIIYDHFLATDPSRFLPGTLPAFAARTYALLNAEATGLPPNFLRMLTYMESQDWLSNYALRAGIRRSLEGMVRRAAYLSDDAQVYPLFEEHYVALGDCYRLFFPELEAYAKEQYTFAL